MFQETAPSISQAKKCGRDLRLRCDCMCKEALKKSLFHQVWSMILYMPDSDVKVIDLQLFRLTLQCNHPDKSIDSWQNVLLQGL